VGAVSVEFGVENRVFGGEEQTAVTEPKARPGGDVVKDKGKMPRQLVQDDFGGASVENLAQTEKVQIDGEAKVDSVDERVDG